MITLLFLPHLPHLYIVLIFSWTLLNVVKITLQQNMNFQLKWNITKIAGSSHLVIIVIYHHPTLSRAACLGQPVQAGVCQDRDAGYPKSLPLSWRKYKFQQSKYIREKRKKIYLKIISMYELRQYFSEPQT